MENLLTFLWFTFIFGAALLMSWGRGGRLVYALASIMFFAFTVSVFGAAFSLWFILLGLAKL